MEKKYDCNKRYLFYLPEYFDENLKHGIGSLIKSNRSLAENKIKCKI